MEAWGARTSHPAPNEWTVPLHSIRTWRGAPRLGSVVEAGRSVWRLARGLWAHRPDVVHLHFVRFEAVYFLLLRPFFRYRLVLTFHGSDVRAPDRASARALPFLVRRADGVTSVNRPILTHLRTVQKMSAPTAVVPNGIDVDFWSAARPQAPGRQTIVAVGRFERVKGFDVLIDAFAQLRRTTNAELLLVGDGRERASLERRVAEAGLADAVSFAGLLDAPDVRKAFQRATVHALPSRSEGHPLVVLEAMAAGLPVVATRVGGVPDLVTEETGTLVDPEDASALAGALRRYLADPARAARAGAAGRRSVRSYSVDAMVEAYERLYAQAMVSGPPRGVEVREEVDPAGRHPAPHLPSRSSQRTLTHAA